MQCDNGFSVTRPSLNRSVTMQYKQAVSLSLRRHYSVLRTWESRGSYTYSMRHALTPSSSSRSPPLEGGGPSTFAAGPRCISIQRMPSTSGSIYTTLLEVIQLMSIAGYEAYVCVCFFMYKHYVQPTYGCRGMPVVARMCVYTAG